jgi:hypothetical protein
MAITFKIDRVNENCMQRGVEVFSMEIFDNGESQGFLWMSEKHIPLNIRDHGESEALTVALECLNATDNAGTFAFRSKPNKNLSV